MFYCKEGVEFFAGQISDILIFEHTKGIEGREDASRYDRVTVLNVEGYLLYDSLIVTDIVQKKGMTMKRRNKVIDDLTKLLYNSKIIGYMILEKFKDLHILPKILNCETHDISLIIDKESNGEEIGLTRICRELNVDSKNVNSFSCLDLARIYCGYHMRNRNSMNKFLSESYRKKVKAGWEQLKPVTVSQEQQVESSKGFFWISDLNEDKEQAKEDNFQVKKLFNKWGHVQYVPVPINDDGPTFIPFNDEKEMDPRMEVYNKKAKYGVFSKEITEILVG